MRLAAAALGLLLAVDPAGAAAGPPPGVDVLLAKAEPLDLHIRPVGITGELAPGLVLRGAWVLGSDYQSFGGFSGLVLSEGMLYALSDRGSLLRAAYSVGSAGLTLSDVRMARLLDPQGRRPRRVADRDSEGLTLTASGLAVSYERKPRIMSLGGDGRMHDTARSPAFERLEYNGGLEALATLPDGRMLALAETRENGGAPVFVIGAGGSVEERLLTLSGDEAVTGADVGPDGRLYLVRRSFSLIFGASILVMRFELGPDGFPVAGSGETLAAFGSADGIDNMEGIALDGAADGALRLWLISDDNSFFLQRTLLVMLELPV